MSKYISLNNSETKRVHFLSDFDYQKAFEKGWAYSFVYHFKEIRDVFLVLREIGFSNLKDFSKKFIEELNVEHIKTPWHSRRILEHINALVNFGLVSQEEKKIKDFSFFKNSEIGDPLTDSDLEDFKRIFFSYYRFQEIMSWFISLDTEFKKDFIISLNEKVVKDKSSLIYTFIRDSRFNDTFLSDLKKDSTVYIIPNSEEDKNEHLMRFWDMFIKWGTELSVIEKFSLKSYDIELSLPHKSLSCVYFKRDLEPGFNLYNYLNVNYNERYIGIKELIFDLIKKYRYSIKDLHNEIIKLEREKFEEISLQRTSEKFLFNSDSLLLPKVNDAYVSHILRY